MATNNAQIFFKKYGNIDIAKYFDPEALKTLAIDPNSDTVDFKITNGGELLPCFIAAVPEDTVFKLNGPLIKRDAPALYNDLLVAGSALGEILFSLPGASASFSTSFVSVKIKLMGNPSEFADVSIKLQK